MDFVVSRRAVVSRGALGVVALTLAAGLAFAQPARIRGTIEKVDGNTLTVKSREGTQLTVKLADNATVSAVVKAALTDIKPNTFVGIASLPGADGSLRALEVLVFPEALRGTGEGHYPWDLKPQSMMTNAAVSTMVTKVDGSTLTLKYKDGEKTIVVPPEAPIVTFAPGTRDELKPGAAVIIFGPKLEADGSFTAGRITVGRGIAPPM